MKRCCFLLFLLYPSFWVSAQNTPFVTYLGVEHGLSNNSVSYIFQDHSGYMWFGTYDGLNRYNGYECKIFRHRFEDTTSLVNNWISCISEDKDNKIWVGTRDGADVYDPVYGKFYRVRLLDKDGRIQQIHSTINDIKADRDGNIYLATSTKGLLYCPKGKTTATQIGLYVSGSRFTDYYAMSIAFAGDTLWSGIRERGIACFNKKRLELKLLNNSPLNNTCLQTDNQGNLYIGGDNGLYKYSIISNSVQQIFNSSNRVVHLDFDAGQLWMASDGDGLMLKSSYSDSIRRITSGNNKLITTSSAVFSVYHDRDQRTWIGTLRGGVNVIDPQKNKFIAIRHDPTDKNSLINNFVLSCSEDSTQNLWIGTDGGGVSFWNRRTHHFSNFMHQPAVGSLSSNFVTSILNDAMGNTWLGTWGGGINRYDSKSGHFTYYDCFNGSTKQLDKNIWMLYQDKSKQIWAGTCLEGGLYRFNRATDSFEEFDSRLKNILTLYEDKSGQLWGGNYNSLIRIDKVSKRHICYLLNFAVRNIQEDNNLLWIATEGGGLLQFNPLDGRFTRYTEKEGLANNSVSKILKDGNGNFWLSTFSGISVFSPTTRTFLTNISHSDGLLSDQLGYNAALLLQSGEMAFGGINGLNLFFPENLTYSSRQHPVFLTKLTINNTPVESDSTYVTGKTNDRISSIRLPYDKAVLSINFSSIEYEAADKINYAYQLEGWDKDWIEGGKNRVATYTRLREGSYLFKVKVSDKTGSWNQSEQLMKVTVLPPWYRTWWAYLLYMTLAGTLIYLYNRYRVQKLKLAYEVVYAKKETEREKELNERKLSFFTNVSHEFRTPLTLIINPLKELLEAPSHNGQSGQLATVYRNAKRLLSLVDQLLVFRKTETESGEMRVRKVNLDILCREVYSCFTQLASIRHIKYEYKNDQQETILYLDHEKIEICLFNLLSNAFKFTPESGAISLIVEDGDEEVCISISDNGCGITETAESHGNIFQKFFQNQNGQQEAKNGFGIGLYLVNEFVTAHKGSVTYTTEKGKGTKFIISLKKGFTHVADFLSAEDGEPTVSPLSKLSEKYVDTQVQKENKDSILASEELFTDQKQILLVDDNAEILNYLADILRSHYTVHKAGSGEEGMRLAEKETPDLIISDISMPGMNGVELCKKTKEHPALQFVPVILLTAASSEEIKLKGIECGADDYITKPFDNRLLLARIENILKSRNALQRYFFDTITLQQPSGKISADYKSFLERCIQVVENNLDREDFSIKTLGKEIGMSHSGLYKKIKMISGLSANAFIRFIRLRRAAVLLLTTETNISEVSFAVGINDIKYFREQFNKLFGMNPSEYVKKYKGTIGKDYRVRMA